MSDYSREYYRKNRQRILEKRRERRLALKKKIQEYCERKALGEKIPAKEAVEMERLMACEYEKYVGVCKKVLECYTFRGMEKVKERIGCQVEAYFEMFPFEKFGEPMIMQELRRSGIRKDRGEFQECYDAGMVAYLYSIHRCADLRCATPEAYVRKIIRIYVHCSQILYRDAYNLCRVNQFRLAEHAV